jgi:hypothetical protein
MILCIRLTAIQKLSNIVLAGVLGGVLLTTFEDIGTPAHWCMTPHLHLTQRGCRMTTLKASVASLLLEIDRTLIS